MWNTLSEPWQAAVAEAWAAYCAASVPIGAAITDASGTVIARGRNRLAVHDSATGYVHGTRLAHAEVNALLKLDMRVDATTCALYTTAEPCPLCAGATRMAQIGNLHFASYDPPAGSATLLNSTPFFRTFPTTTTGPQDDDFADVTVALRAERAIRIGTALALYVVEELRTIHPRGVALGKTLAASGALLGMRTASAAEAVDALAGML